MALRQRIIENLPLDDKPLDSVAFYKGLDKVLHNLKTLEREAKNAKDKAKKRMYIHKAEREKLAKLEASKIVVVFNNITHWSGFTIKDLAGLMEAGRKARADGHTFEMPARPFIQNFLKSNAFRNIKLPKSMLKKDTSFNTIKKDLEDDINLKFYNWFYRQNTLAPLSEDYLKSTAGRRKSPKPLRYSDTLIRNVHFEVAS